MKTISKPVRLLGRLAAGTAMMALAISPVAAEAKSKKRDSAVQSPQSFPQAERDYDASFSGRPAVQRVRVPGGLFVSKPVNDLAPQSLLAKRVEIDIRSDVPTLSDLQMLLEAEGIHITVDYNSLYEAAKVSDEVGSFTAASKFQQVANSVKGGTGVQQQGVGGLGGGFGSSGGFGSGYDVASQGSGQGYQGGANPNVTIQGAASSDNGQGGVTPQQQAPQESEKAEGNGRPAFYGRVLPFRYFKGTVGELMRRLENTGNIAVWYQDGLVLGGMRRYSVAMLQQQDVMQSVVNELRNLGATQVVGSVGAGELFYSAPPRTNSEIIEPYLRRVSGNLSEVTMQVALVTVAMSRNDERGFDWSALNFGIGKDVTVPTTGTGSGTGTGTGGTVTPVTSQNGVFTINSNAFAANLGDIFGINRIVSVAGAINFLSRMGDTSVAQNVELRTLSGSPVILRSGEDIPYVSGVGSTLGGGISGGSFGSSQTARLGTGLTLNVDPRYDHTSGIVTMDIGMKLVDLVEFVQLDAGNQLGTLTQPRTREQGVNSIVRVPAGQTTILGGIRRDFKSDQKNGPFGLFGIGSRQKQHEVFWLFVIVRPVVTVYETADAPVAPRSILDTRTTVNPYDEGSYGVVGVPGRAVPVASDPTTSNAGGYPSYYGQGGSTPANRIPAGVTTAAPPSPRNVVVPGAATAPEVNPNVPAGAVLRDPGAAGPDYSIATPNPVPVAAPMRPVAAPGDMQGSAGRLGATPIPNGGTMPNGAAVPVVDGQGTDAAVKSAAPAAAAKAPEPAPKEEPRRSFIRPMTASEKGN